MQGREKEDQSNDEDLWLLLPRKGDLWWRRWGMVRVGMGWVICGGVEGKVGGGGGGGGCGRGRGLRRFGGVKGVLCGGGGCLDYEGMVVDDALPIVITDKILTFRKLTDDIYTDLNIQRMEYPPLNADASYAHQ